MTHDIDRTSSCDEGGAAVYLSESSQRDDPQPPRNQMSKRDVSSCDNRDRYLAGAEGSFVTVTFSLNARERLSLDMSPNFSNRI
jgi:hypothetical protein